MLVTRPEPGATQTARLIAALGYQPVLAPLLRVRPLPFRAPAGLHAILITSGNAVPSLPALLHGIPLLAVGKATADRARAAGFATVLSADGDARDLAELARRHLPRCAVLLATGRKQGTALAAELRQAGFVVHRRVVYAAHPAGRLPPMALDALRDGRLRAALFLSAETARAFTRVLPPVLHAALPGVDALAIGQPTADALMHLPWRRVRVSAKPTLERVLALL